MTRLSVNVNKIAVLRNSRGGAEPDVVAAAEACIAAGAAGITVHPRPDLRHIRPDDVRALKKRIGDRVEYNIEGNGFAAARGGYPGLLSLVEETRPTQVTLVPDGDAQLTSDHGFDLRADAARLRPLIAELKHLGARVSQVCEPPRDGLGRTGVKLPASGLEQRGIGGDQDEDRGRQAGDEHAHDAHAEAGVRQQPPRPAEAHRARVGQVTRRRRRRLVHVDLVPQIGDGRREDHPRRSCDRTPPCHDPHPPAPTLPGYRR